MKLEAFAVCPDPQPLVPAPPGREWYDRSLDRHFYRCLPISIGNCYGWQLLLTGRVSSTWNGGERIEDLTVECERPYQACSNFAHGLTTFDVGMIFRTPPGYHLMVTAPTNHVKDGVAWLTGIVETDWLPYSFTINTRHTRPGTVTWKAGEPYGQIMVVQAGVMDDVQPVVRRIEDDPELLREHTAWRNDREQFRARMAAGDPVALKDPWSKWYMKGKFASDGRPTEAGHTQKVRLAPFRDERAR